MNDVAGTIHIRTEAAPDILGISPNSAPHEKTLIGGGGVAEMWRMVEFHTDFTQSTGSGPHSVRHPGHPHNAPMPMKSQIDELAVGLPTPRPSIRSTSSSASESTPSGDRTCTATGIPHTIPHKLTRKPGPMTRKRKRRSAIVEIGTGPAKVRIYTITRKDGYGQFTIAWKEGGRRKTRCFACMDEARMIAQQITNQK